MSQRACVLEAAAKAGVRPEILTTQADMFPGPTGLPDAPPYNEMVVLAMGVDQEDPDAIKWASYLWREYTKQEHPQRFPKMSSSAS